MCHLLTPRPPAAGAVHELSGSRAPWGSQTPPDNAPSHDIKMNVGEDTQHQLLRAPPDRNNWPVSDEMTAATYTLNQVQFSGPRTPPRSSGNSAVCFSHDSHDGVSKTSLILSK